MPSLLSSLLGFDRLIGPSLVKIVYYLGAAIIVIVIGMSLLTAIMSLAAGNFGLGLIQLLAAPIVAAVVFVYWRFVCELFMLAFLAYQRLGEIRDTLRSATGAPDPNHPTF